MAHLLRALQESADRRPRIGGWHLEVSDHRLAVLMILPAVILVTAFSIYPVLQGVYASFFQIEPATLDMRFTGIENYRRLLAESLFWHSLGRTLIWVVTTTAA